MNDETIEVYNYFQDGTLIDKTVKTPTAKIWYPIKTRICSSLDMSVFKRWDITKNYLTINELWTNEL